MSAATFKISISSVPLKEIGIAGRRAWGYLARYPIYIQSFKTVSGRRATTFVPVQLEMEKALILIRN